MEQTTFVESVIRERKSRLRGDDVISPADNRYDVARKADRPQAGCSVFPGEVYVNSLDQGEAHRIREAYAQITIISWR